jgi:ribonuclease HII
MLKLSYGNNNEEIQVGVDEAGRGCMIGNVFAGAVIWDPSIDPWEIKDSKKLTRKKRKLVKEYIEQHAIAWSVGFATNEEIDEINILNATYLAMHRALSNLNKPFDRILVDGNRFKPFQCIPHTCVISGDNELVSIAAASILAKEYHDEWITNLFDPDFDNSFTSDNDIYDLMNNKGYGTKKHIEAIRQYGITNQHRLSYCKKFI